MRQYLALAFVSLTLLAARTASAGEPVRPESLSQGFVLVVTDAAGQADDLNPIYLASNFNGWNPVDPFRQLERRADGRWAIAVTAPSPDAAMEFKFTQGGWNREELDAEGHKIANRTLPTLDSDTIRDGVPPEIELTAVRFREVATDAGREAYDPSAPLEVTGELKRVQVVGGGGEAASLERDLLVWLPPGYEDAANAGRRYPVLYMFDAQNLFDPPPGIPGEWHVDETLTELIGAGRVEPIIVVGIPHAGTLRISEYLPFDALKWAKPAGRECLDWVVSTVMPKIERDFRVSTRPEDTAIGGSSLGGLMALVAAGDHPDRFGKALIESPSLLSEDGHQVREYAHAVKRWPGKVVVGMGGREASSDSSDADRNKQYRDWAHELDALLADAGLGADRRLLILDEEAHHTESAWAARFPRAVEFLFPAKDE